MRTKAIHSSQQWSVTLQHIHLLIENHVIVLCFDSNESSPQIKYDTHNPRWWVSSQSCLPLLIQSVLHPSRMLQSNTCCTCTLLSLSIWISLSISLSVAISFADKLSWRKSQSSHTHTHSSAHPYDFRIISRTHWSSFEFWFYCNIDNNINRPTMNDNYPRSNSLVLSWMDLNGCNEKKHQDELV